MQSNEQSLGEYDHLVERWICEVLSRGPLSFANLVAALPSVYPSVARDVLTRLSNHHLNLRNPSNQVDQIASLDDEQSHIIPLPTPHPLDYDWRFTHRTVTYLLEVCATLATPNVQIALMGTPTIFRAALEQTLAYRFTLFENNPAVVAALIHEHDGMAVIRCNLIGDPLPKLTAHVVIADPPWYEYEIHAFLWAARQLCADTGHVVMSVPPLGTRPGMAAEWARTVFWAERLGLRLLRLEPGVLSYVTPLFEHNALLADGISMVPYTWRRGDLAVFEVVASCTASRPLRISTDDRWDEAMISGVRLRLRQQQQNDFRDPTLKQLINGDVLPSVSRRDPRRAAIDVWTSGNRVFSCHGTPTLCAIAQAMAVGLPPRDAVSALFGRSLQKAELRLIDQATRQLYHIVAREHREAAVGLRRVSHDNSLYRHSC